MASDAYLALLRDPRWQRRRLEIMQRDGWRCRTCGASDQTLNVHHVRYVRGRDPWDYEDSELMTMCEHCHQEQTEFTRELKSLSEQAVFNAPLSRRALGFLRATVAHQNSELSATTLIVRCEDRSVAFGLVDFIGPDAEGRESLVSLVLSSIENGEVDLVPAAKIARHIDESESKE